MHAIALYIANYGIPHTHAKGNVKVTTIVPLLSYRPAKNQGPVVQTIVSLTSSLRGQLVKCFTTL